MANKRTRKGRGSNPESPRQYKRRLARLNEAAAWLLRDSKRLLKKNGGRLDASVVARLEQLRGDLELACEAKPADRDADRLEEAATDLDEALQQ